jgi:hypothetical protein
MSDLKMWTDGIDNIIAPTLERVLEIWREHMDDDYDVDVLEAWEEIPLDKELTLVHVDDDGQPKETKTVAGWIAQNGEGFFSSTEW